MLKGAGFNIDNIVYYLSRCLDVSMCLEVYQSASKVGMLVGYLLEACI